jgi:microcin C transport system substrate-binding protein
LIRAQALLSEAGWDFKGGQLVNADGEVFRIEFLVRSKSAERWLLPYIARLAKLGIDGKIRLLGTALYLNIRRENRNDAALGSLAVSFPPNQELPAYFASSSAGLGNFARMSSPVVDELIEAVMNATSSAELMTACRALDRVLWWEFYFIPVEVLQAQRNVVWDTLSWPHVTAPYHPGFPDTWWWDAAKAQRVEQALGKP